MLPINVCGIYGNKLDNSKNCFWNNNDKKLKRKKISLLAEILLATIHPKLNLDKLSVHYNLLPEEELLIVTGEVERDK